MSVITLNNDSLTLTLNGRVYNNLAEGDTTTLTPVNELTSRINSAQNGVTIAKRMDAGVHDMVVRVQKYSDDDIELNSLRNAESPALIAGSVKENFIKDGTDGVETIELQAGSITAQPTNTKNNTDNNALMEYTIQFRNVVRSL